MRELAVRLVVFFILLQTLPFCCSTAGLSFGNRRAKPTQMHYYYAGYDLGLFRKSGIFKSLPWPGDPKTLGLRLFLYPPGKKEAEINISTLTSRSNDRLDIRPNATLMFVIHGCGGSKEEWPLELKRNVFGREFPYLHLIVVDWVAGAAGKTRHPKYQRELRRASLIYKMFSYDKAASNARIVGSIIGNVIFAIKQSELYSIGYVHCVGFSLGAHVCGFAGKTYSKEMGVLDRITGLDPAGPLFTEAKPNERLDRTDARFVDIIHTNTLFFGINRTIGHVDFWVGRQGLWGAAQPGCIEGGLGRWALRSPSIWMKDYIRRVVSWMKKYIKRIPWRYRRPKINGNIACSHAQAVTYFAQSLDGTCKYEIPNTNGLQMGFFAQKEKIPQARHNIFVTIKEKYPYCGEFE